MAFTYHTKSDCPVCGKSNGDCRTSRSIPLTLCHTFHGEYADGMKYTGESRCGVWGKYWHGQSNYADANGTKRRTVQSKKRRIKEKRKWRIGDDIEKAPAAIRAINDYAVPVEQRAQLFTDDIGVNFGFAEAFKVEYLPLDPSHGARQRDCWVVPVYDGGEKLIGYHSRYLESDPEKKDGKRNVVSNGLFIPNGWRNHPALETFGLFLVEGFTDALALHAAGLCAIGRPSNTGGVEQLAELLKDLPKNVAITVVGENDRKFDKRIGKARWEGRKGAISTATELAQKLGRTIQWGLPEDKFKDSRDWYLDAKGRVENQAIFIGYEDWTVEARRFGNIIIKGAEFCSPDDPETAEYKRAQLEEEEARQAVVGDLGTPDTPAEIEAKRREREWEEERQRISDETHRRVREENRKDAEFLRSLCRRPGCGKKVTQIDPSLDSDYLQRLHVRCGNWYDCELCRELNKRWHKGHVVGLCTRSIEFWTGLIPRDDYEARTKEIRRAGGNYKTIKQPNGLIFILADRPFKGSLQSKDKPATADDAIRLTQRAIDDIPTFSTDNDDTVNHSKKWLPRKESSGLVTLCSELANSEDGQILCEKYGLRFDDQVKAVRGHPTIEARQTGHSPRFRNQKEKGLFIKNFKSVCSYFVGQGFSRDEILMFSPDNLLCEEIELVHISIKKGRDKEDSNADTFESNEGGGDISEEHIEAIWNDPTLHLQPLAT